MKQYVKTDGTDTAIEYPYGIAELRRDYPDSSPPKVLNDTYMASRDAYPVTPTPRPEITATQVATKSDLPVKLADGSWAVEWVVRDKTEEELLKEIPWKNATEARKAVVEWIDGLTAQIESLYPSSVQKRWLIEEAAARAVASPDISATQDQIDMMTAEGAAKGRTPEEHAAAVIENADRFRRIADETNKLFLATDKALQEAASPLEYPAIFENAKAQAMPLAAAYGLELE